MNTPTVVLSVLLACGGAFAITLLARPADETSPNPALGAALAEVGNLRDQVARLEARLEHVAATPAASSAAPQRVEVPTLSSEQVGVAVEAYLRARGGNGVAPADGEPIDIDALYAELHGTRFDENPDAWRKAHADGRMDELIAKFEADARAFPKDVNVQMELARAYLAYTQMDPSKYEFSMKADETFDGVLAIDERHWEARFTKAVSYTFWPDFLGKKTEALSHFETLVNQQEDEPAQDHHAMTYLFLGNLLESKDPARAREMWQRGAARHPDNAELRQRLGQ